MPYVIVELNERYNDEVYTIDDDNGSPVGVVSDKARAEEICKQKNIEKLRGLQVGGYGYDVNDISNFKTMHGLLRKLPFLNPGEAFDDEESESYELRVPQGATQEQLEQAYDVLTLRFFAVEEVEEL